MTKADIVNEVSKNTGIEKVTVRKLLKPSWKLLKTHW